MQPRKAIVRRRPLVAGPVDLGNQRVAAVEHDQDAAQQQRRTGCPPTIPRYFGKAERPGDIRRQRDRPADRTPEIIPGEQRADESPPAFGAQHPEDDRCDDEGEEDDAAHHRGHRQHVDRVEQTEEMARGHGLVPAGRPWRRAAGPRCPASPDAYRLRERSTIGNRDGPVGTPCRRPDVARMGRAASRNLLARRHGPLDAQRRGLSHRAELEVEDDSPGLPALSGWLPGEFTPADRPDFEMVARLARRSRRSSPLARREPKTTPTPRGRTSTVVVCLIQAPHASPGDPGRGSSFLPSFISTVSPRRQRTTHATHAQHRSVVARPAWQGRALASVLIRRIVINRDRQLTR